MIPSVLADEGMWLVNMIESRLHRQMAAAGLKMSAEEIYDESKVSLSDAIVSLAFSCSGSMISNDGLMITNHHCAYGDIHDLSTPENNYLENGFAAASRSEELPAPSAASGVWFLKKVIDVTGEVMHLRDSLHADRNVMAQRRINSMIENKYGKIFEGQGEVICSSYWAGSRYMVALYQVYKDVRLVAAPPLCMASFGAEEDNWEWPQQKCDFALYRIYTAPDGSPAEYSPDNVPFHPRRTLSISTSGINEGEYVMIMGYPGKTNRYCSSFAVENTAKIVNPIQARYMGERMKIIDKWMNADPVIRLKYADRYFMLTNVQEIREGEIYCYNRFGVPAIKAETQEKALREAGHGAMIDSLQKKYRDLEWITSQMGHNRETIIQGFNLFRVSNTITNYTSKLIKDKKTGAFKVSDDPKRMKEWLDNFDKYDMRVERELFDFALKQYVENVDKRFWSKVFAKVYGDCGGNMDAVVSTIWDNSIFTDRGRLTAAFNEEHTPDYYSNDIFNRFVRGNNIRKFNQVKDSISGKISVSKAETDYKQALYRLRLEKGIPQYADANSTMRLTYGTVRGINPRDAVSVDWKSTTEGILEKYNPDVYIFSLKSDVKKLLEERDWGRWGENGRMTVNFSSDNDITGGNSGSAIIDACGNLVGLAFDGNKEGLAGDTWFDPQMNRTISVDIRYVMWTLDKVLGCGYLLDEMTFTTTPKGSLNKSKRRNADRK